MSATDEPNPQLIQAVGELLLHCVKELHFVSPFICVAVSVSGAYAIWRYGPAKPPRTKGIEEEKIGCSQGITWLTPINIFMTDARGEVAGRAMQAADSIDRPTSETKH